MQAVAVRAVEVGMVEERMHLVHAHIRELVCMGIERVDQRPWFAVRERDDDVGTFMDVRQYGFGRGRAGGDSDATHSASRGRGRGHLAGRRRDLWPFRRARIPRTVGS